MNTIYVRMPSITEVRKKRSIRSKQDYYNYLAKHREDYVPGAMKPQKRKNPDKRLPRIRKINWFDYIERRLAEYDD